MTFFLPLTTVPLWHCKKITRTLRTLKTEQACSLADHCFGFGDGKHVTKRAEGQSVFSITRPA